MVNPTTTLRAGTEVVVQMARGATRYSSTWRRAVADLVFPPACVICHTELDGEAARAPGLPFCGACFDELDLLIGPTCTRCGGPLPILHTDQANGAERASRPPGCFRCRKPKLWFDETVAAGMYAGRLRELVLRMKDSAGDSLSLSIGQLVWRQCGERLQNWQPDVVVPIPSHWRRWLEHRTNSAAVLAEVLARRLRVPLVERLLRRRRHTVRQAELTPPQRWENMRRAFSARAGYHLRSAHVLLVDDILTTGATCSEAARALRSAGAERVSVVVAGRAIG